MKTSMKSLEKFYRTYGKKGKELVVIIYFDELKSQGWMPLSHF